MEKYNELLKRLVPGLVEILGDPDMKIILYGSVARGEDTEESDVDIAVILKSCAGKTRDKMLDFVVELELEYDIVLSVLLIDSENFSEWENVLPFYINVKKEGITLWPAA